MTIQLPIFLNIKIHGYGMYPGNSDSNGINHAFTPGLHLIAGVNGLGKSTLILMLYHGLVGPASVRNEDFGVPKPEITPHRFVDRFRRRVADGGQSSYVAISFKFGEQHYWIRRSLYDLSLLEWRLNGTDQDPVENTYVQSIVNSAGVGSFSDILTLLNAITFMFENRELLIWSPLTQRNALRSLFMLPKDANLLSEKAQKVATLNSAYRNLLYIVNREQKQLNKNKAAASAADALSAEYHTLQKAVDAQSEILDKLYESRKAADDSRTENRATLESAKFNYDDLLRELEALKLARVATAFPTSTEAGRYVIARIIGDKECLSCGAANGPLIDRWIKSVADGDCLICGSPPSEQETVIPKETVDAARIAKAEARLGQARLALNTANNEYDLASKKHDAIQVEIDKIVREKHNNEQRIRQIAGTVPPSAPFIRAQEERLENQKITLLDLHKQQVNAEGEFSLLFEKFRVLIEEKSEKIRERFIARISDFLVERAEITFSTVRAPIGESGQSYDWPSFKLSMTSGTFDNPTPRRSRSEVSQSQGEFIDLSFRLALIDVAAEGGACSLVFDAPEASLDALFMRRAGAFLAQFTKENRENRLIVTSNLTNADMIPALFGAYEPEQGDPAPTTIPRSERRNRVIDLLNLAAPTSAVSLVGDRYRNLLDRALFPPDGSEMGGL